jgi:Na+-translocating ferredoxin:NAD+ oxidoreductase RNF subunit RnfB
MPDLTGGFELSRDADKIVTATEVRVVCRHCGYWSAGSYAGALASFEEHWGYCVRG